MRKRVPIFLAICLASAVQFGPQLILAYQVVSGSRSVIAALAGLFGLFVHSLAQVVVMMSLARWQPGAPADPADWASYVQGQRKAGPAWAPPNPFMRTTGTNEAPMFPGTPARIDEEAFLRP